jgi:hypothetical protein
MVDRDRPSWEEGYNESDDPGRNSRGEYELKLLAQKAANDAIRAKRLASQTVPIGAGRVAAAYARTAPSAKTYVHDDGQGGTYLETVSVAEQQRREAARLAGPQLSAAARKANEDRDAKEKKAEAAANLKSMANKGGTRGIYAKYLSGAMGKDPTFAKTGKLTPQAQASMMRSMSQEIGSIRAGAGLSDPDPAKEAADTYRMVSEEIRKLNTDFGRWGSPAVVENLIQTGVTDQASRTGAYIPSYDLRGTTALDSFGAVAPRGSKEDMLANVYAPRGSGAQTYQRDAPEVRPILTRADGGQVQQGPDYTRGTIAAPVGPVPENLRTGPQRQKGESTPDFLWRLKNYEGNEQNIGQWGYLTTMGGPAAGVDHRGVGPGSGSASFPGTTVDYGDDDFGGYGAFTKEATDRQFAEEDWVDPQSLPGTGMDVYQKAWQQQQQDEQRRQQAAQQRAQYDAAQEGRAPGGSMGGGYGATDLGDTSDPNQGPNRGIIPTATATDVATPPGGAQLASNYVQGGGGWSPFAPGTAYADDSTPTEKTPPPSQPPPQDTGQQFQQWGGQMGQALAGIDWGALATAGGGHVVPREGGQGYQGPNKEAPWGYDPYTNRPYASAEAARLGEGAPSYGAGSASPGAGGGQPDDMPGGIAGMSFGGKSHTVRDQIAQLDPSTDPEAGMKASILQQIMLAYSAQESFEHRARQGNVTSKDIAEMDNISRETVAAMEKSVALQDMNFTNQLKTFQQEESERQARFQRNLAQAQTTGRWPGGEFGLGTATLAQQQLTADTARLEEEQRQQGLRLGVQQTAATTAQTQADTEQSRWNATIEETRQKMSGYMDTARKNRTLEGQKFDALKAQQDMEITGTFDGPDGPQQTLVSRQMAVTEMSQTMQREATMGLQALQKTSMLQETERMQIQSDKDEAINSANIAAARKNHVDLINLEKLKLENQKEMTKWTFIQDYISDPVKHLVASRTGLIGVIEQMLDIDFGLSELPIMDGSDLGLPTEQLMAVLSPTDKRLALTEASLRNSMTPEGVQWGMGQQAPGTIMPGYSWGGTGGAR